jgi:hypothetical protein
MMDKQALLNAIESKLKDEGNDNEVHFLASIKRSDQRDGTWYETGNVTVSKSEFDKGQGIEAKTGYSRMFLLSDNDALKLAHAIIKLVM